MAKTLANLTTQCRTILDETSEADWQDSQIYSAINYAYLEMYTAVVETYEDYYRTLVTTSTIEDQQEYAIPSDMYKLRRLEVKYDSDGDYAKARAYPINQTSLPFDTTSYSATNIPIYELTGNYIRLLPIPDETIVGGLRMIYIATESELVDTDDEINIPFADRYAKYIVWGACAMLLSKGQQEETVASKYEDLFQVGLEKMKNELENRYADGAKMIQDTQGSNNDFGNQ